MNNFTEEPLAVEAQNADAGTRLDVFVSVRFDVTRSNAAKYIENGALTVNGSAQQKNYKLRTGDYVELIVPEPEPCEAVPEEIPLDIVYEDDDIIVINKPSGMVVHPGAGNFHGTLVNALMWHEAHLPSGVAGLSGIGGVERPGIVHRIDKETSGLLVVAKNDAAHLNLSEQIKVHAVSRVYYAVCLGNFDTDSGIVNLPVGRNPCDRIKMAVFKNGGNGAREAVTHYEVMRRFETGQEYGTRLSLVRCVLETGRTHQIRVHMSAISHPILGDPLYGGDSNRFCRVHAGLIDGQCLHAGELTLTHPKNGKIMRFEAPLPENMKRILSILEES